MEVTGLQNGVEHSSRSSPRPGIRTRRRPPAPAYVAVPDQMAAHVEARMVADRRGRTRPLKSKVTHTIFVAPQAGGQPIAQSVAAGTENYHEPFGLQNGAIYLVSIQAQNGAKSPSPVSNPTQGSPHGPPSILGNITVSTTAMAPDASTATVRGVSLDARSVRMEVAGAGRRSR